MKKVLIFSGTTEGRDFAWKLAKAGRESVVCVATEYGELVMHNEAHEKITVHKGRMTEPEMEDFLGKYSFCAVVDATHPYAVEVSENIWNAVRHYEEKTKKKLPYYRLNREEQNRPDKSGMEHFFADMEHCAVYLEQKEGNILLTTGSKELKKFVSKLSDKERVFARVLPAEESLALCREAGLAGRQIIAMQGPFSAELNRALIRQFQISYLVTKESGRAGGQAEKQQAARLENIETCVIAKPAQIAGYREEELLSVFGITDSFTQKNVEKEDENRCRITLVGIGMGNRNTLTKEAERAIADADMLFGAKRILEAVEEFKKPVQPFYLAKDIIGYLKEKKEIKNVAVLFSGDLGFYSGAEKFRREIEKESGFEVRSYAGISSVAYFAAQLGVSYQEAVLSSIHGKMSNVVQTVRRNEKSFFLLSGESDALQLEARLRRALLQEEADAIEITWGYQLSYPEERIWRAERGGKEHLAGEGLYIAYVKNPLYRTCSLTHGLPDSAFLREKIPMTKEEVRTVSLSKLRLGKDAVFFDIGSGTGSISVEAARISETIAVHAFEQKEEAAVLLEKNKEKFGLCNITVHRVKAPDGFDNAPIPTHAFIGGSGGNFKEIAAKLYAKNPAMRVVVNAVTLETLAEVTQIVQSFPVREWETVQLQTARAKECGAYHLMQAENPVFVISFTFEEEQGKEHTL